jgi:hypothetical protein
MIRRWKLAIITVGLAASTASAAIVATGLDAVQFVPADVRLNQTESDVRIIAFNERQQCVTLAADLPVDNGVIPKGTKVKSHFIHEDAVTATVLDGRVRFDTQILGVISTSAGLDATDALFGRPGVTYPPSGSEPFRGLEPGVQLDQYQIILGGFGIQVRLEIPVDSFTDQIRVLNCCDGPPGGGGGD